MTSQIIELSEYESALVSLSAEGARTLADVAGKRLAVAVGPSPGVWEVTAGSYVGALVTPDVELLIRPKVPLHNVFHMLDVGIGPEAFSTERFAFASDRSLLAVLAELFGRAIERAIGAGLLRSYSDKRERVPTLRGRIDFPELISQPGLPLPLPCRFDEYTADIMENRALKSAVRQLLRVPGVRPLTRRTLATELARFEDVADAFVDPGAIDRLVYTRLNRHYEPALDLASLILRNLTLLDRIGPNDATAFLVDMNDVFERWVTDRLRRHLRGSLGVVAQHTEHLGIGRRIPMYPDLEFLREDQLAYVADVKYKLTASGLGRNADYYQLLAYATTLRQPEGLLIYCQAGDDVPDREVVVRHAGTSLRTWALDLRGSPADVEASVAELATWIWTRVRERELSAVGVA